MEPNRTEFVTTYKPIAGWKAVLFWWNTEEFDREFGFWEPWDTSPFAFATEAEAIEYARWWAETEEIRYVPRGENAETWKG